MMIWKIKRQRNDETKKQRVPNERSGYCVLQSENVNLCKKDRKRKVFLILRKREKGRVIAQVMTKWSVPPQIRAMYYFSSRQVGHTV